MSALLIKCKTDIKQPMNTLLVKKTIIIKICKDWDLLSKGLILIREIFLIMSLKYCKEEYLQREKFYIWDKDTMKMEIFILEELKHKKCTAKEFSYIKIKIDLHLELFLKENLTN